LVQILRKFRPLLLLFLLFSRRIYTQKQLRDGIAPIQSHLWKP
jgi:hypothetical protein